MAEFSEWSIIELLSGMDTSEAADSLRVPQALPISDPFFLDQPSSRAGEEFTKAVMDSQPLVEIFGFEPDVALSAVRSNGQVQAQELIKRKVSHIVRKAPEWQKHFTGLVNQFRKNLNQAGYSTAKDEPWNRVRDALVKFVAVEVGATI